MRGVKRTADKLKATISDTRRVIASKFKKLHRDRVSNDMKRKEKLAPLTDSLKKIISQKDAIIKNNERVQHPNEQNDVNHIDRMDIDPIEMDDFIQMPQHAPPPLPPPPPIPPIPPRSRSNNRRRRPPTPPPRYDSLSFRRNGDNQMNRMIDNIVQINRKRSTNGSKVRSEEVELKKLTKQEKKLKTNDQPRTAEQMRNFFDNIIANNGNGRQSRKRRPVTGSSEIDIFDSSNRKNDLKIRREEAELMNLDENEKNLIDLTDDQLSHDSDDGAYGQTNSIRESPSEYELSEDNDDDDDDDGGGGGDDTKYRIVSPDDYDDFGEYKNPGVKRSKHELIEHDVDRSIKRMKSKKLIKELRKRWQSPETTDQNNEFDENALTRQFWKYKEYLMDISPNDFDHDGNFVGTAKRRRELAALIMGLDSKKARKKRPKSGLGLERSFIPYNQNIVYEYYDDPNELCDRLKLLTSSKGAGNTNHDQEINSIVEELRERGIVA